MRSAAIADDAGACTLQAAPSRTVARRTLARSGDREAAIEELRAAAAMLEQVGAVRYRDEAERELQQLGHW
jgi:hypothetical protein